MSAALPTSTDSAPAKSRRIFLLDCPRTTSHLFAKLFSEHKDIQQILFPLIFAYLGGPERMSIPDENTEQEVIEVFQERGKDLTFEKAWRTLLDQIDRIEKEGKFPFIKEHTFSLILPHLDNICPARPIIRAPTLSYPGSTISTTTTNPTYIPAEFLLTVTPIFLIRHPARMIPSLYRANTVDTTGDGTGRMVGGANISSNKFKSDNSLQWSRMIFDWYRDNTDSAPNSDMTRPLVVDADDLLNEPKAIADKICEILGIDADGIVFEWKEVEGMSDLPVGARAFLSVIRQSKGLIKNPEGRKSVTIEREREKWITEFGLEKADAIAGVARGMMSDYEYLMSFRIKAASNEM